MIQVRFCGFNISQLFLREDTEAVTVVELVLRGQLSVLIGRSLSTRGSKVAVSAFLIRYSTLTGRVILYA